MAIKTSKSWQEFTADGDSAYFTFNFNYVDSSEIAVGIRTGENTFSTVEPSNYQVIRNATDDGGQIRFIKDPSGSQEIDDAPVAGTVVRIERKSPLTNSASWQVALEMSNLIALFDKAFRAIQDNRGKFDNTIQTFETQHGVKLMELLEKHNHKMFFWDNKNKTITPTEFPYENVVQATDGMYLRQGYDSVHQIHYLEFSLNGVDNWHRTFSITESQQQALDSGATKALIDQITTNKDNIADLETKKANATDVYTKDEVYNKTEIDSKEQDLQKQIDSNDTDIADLQSTKADKETVYTREEIDGKDTVLQEQITQNTTDISDLQTYVDDTFETKTDAEEAHSQLTDSISTAKSELQTKITANTTDITALKTDKADQTYVDDTFETKTDAQDSHEQLQTAIDNQGSELDAKITANATAITSLQNDKADKSYTDETYQTKADAESQHQELQNQINQNAGEIAELDATKPSKDVDFETPITPENKGATMKEVRDLGSSSLKFKGYVYPTEPEGVSFTNGDLWLASDTMPVDFPVSADKIKKYEDGAWVEYGQDYTVASFDFWRDLNTSVGYYWFGGTWTPMSTDMSTDYFVLNNISGKWEIKNSVNLLGSPTTTTQAGEDSSTKIATTAFVQGRITITNSKIEEGLATKANSADVYDKTAIDTKVSGLQSSIDDNASNIATNKTNIATNTASIEKNAGDIATNTESITALQTSKADTTYVDTTFEKKADATAQYATFETKEDATAQYATFETKTEATTALATKANLTGGNTFTGAQKFNDYITVKDPPTSDNTSTGVSALWVNMALAQMFANKFKVVSELPAEPDPDTFYFIPEA